MSVNDTAIRLVDVDDRSSRTSWCYRREPTTTGRPAGWSPDSRILYLLLDSDGHRCLWAQNVDANGRLDGKPYPARHFHDRANAAIDTSLGNTIAPGGFMYETTLIRGNVWLLSP